MSIPITPLTVAATLQAAQGAAALIEAATEQGAASFARLLEPSTTANATPDNDDNAAGKASEQLQELHRKLLELFEAAGVDTGFPIDITADALNGLKLDSVHLDAEAIQSVLSKHPELAETFNEIERLLVEARTLSSHSGLRLELDKRDISVS